MYFIRTILLLIFLTLAGESFCQTNFQSGYVISLSGDTVRGYIDYREWELNPDKISFKKTPSDVEISYTPQDIKAFSVSAERYESGTVQIETSSDNLSALEYDARINLSTITCFLQVLVSGEKSLFYYIDKSRKAQYFIKTTRVMIC